MADPIVLRLVRPYDSEEDYLAAEAWTVDAKGMLLLDQPVLPAGTIVRFDITLRDGTKVIRAEGKVVGVAAARRGRPGGLKVRFKRFGGATKSLIDRVVAERKKDKKSQRPPSRSQRPPSRSQRPPSRSQRPPRSQHPPRSQRPPRANLTLEKLSEVDVSDLEKTEPMPPVTSKRASPPEPERASAPRSSRPGPVAAPVNREELLERLRARARAKASS